MKGPERRWQKRGLISFGLGFLLFVVAAGTIELEGANVLTWMMLAAAGVFVAAAFVLIALGPRADKKV
jgi:hypothetical protein